MSEILQIQCFSCSWCNHRVFQTFFLLSVGPTLSYQSVIYDLKATIILILCCNLTLIQINPPESVLWTCKVFIQKSGNFVIFIFLQNRNTRPWYIVYCLLAVSHPSYSGFSTTYFLIFRPYNVYPAVPGQSV